MTLWVYWLLLQTIKSLHQSSPGINIEKTECSQAEGMTSVNQEV